MSVHTIPIKRVASALGVPDTEYHVLQRIEELNECSDKQAEIEKRNGYLEARFEVLHNLAYESLPAIVWRRFRNYWVSWRFRKYTSWIFE